MKISQKRINISLKKEIEKAFVQSIADIKTINESKVFLADFLTKSEFETFSKRLAVAYWLKKGRSYENIKQNLKVSSATIASVQENLEKKGFQIVLKKLEAEEWANQWSVKIKKFVRR